MAIEQCYRQCNKYLRDIVLEWDCVEKRFDEKKQAK